MNLEVLNYLRKKFPEVKDDKIFCTDYSGDVYEKIIDEDAILTEISTGKICANCEFGQCKLPESVKAKNSRVITKICEDSRGKKYLDVRRTCGLCCKFDRLRGKFGRIYKNSGLTFQELDMTFENYVCENNNDLRLALHSAFIACKTGDSLIIGGKRGTGKTHLAISIAIENMRNGAAAKFRLVSSMLDELREAALKTNNFFEFIKTFQEVPCLILDDFGKEKITPAAIEYLHKIIDFRYRNNLQTIITTNAVSSEELAEKLGAEFAAPIISRMSERGRWISIINADDYRTKRKF